MARYSARHPFSPLADLVVRRRGVTVNGVRKEVGDIIPAGTLRDRVAASFYENRLVDMAEVTPSPKPEATKGAKAARGAKAAEPAPAPETPPADGESIPADGGAKPTLNEGGHRVKQAGLGGFKVLSPAGEVIGQGWPTHAEAVAEALRLDAAAEQPPVEG